MMIIGCGGVCHMVNLCSDCNTISFMADGRLGVLEQRVIMYPLFLGLHTIARDMYWL